MWNNVKMARGLLTIRVLCLCCIFDAKVSVEVDEERLGIVPTGIGTTGMGALISVACGFGDGHGEVAEVSTLIEDDFLERMWEDVDVESSDEVEGEGDGGGGEGKKSGERRENKSRRFEAGRAK